MNDNKNPSPSPLVLNKETIKDLKPCKVELPDSVWLPPEMLREIAKEQTRESTSYDD